MGWKRRILLTLPTEGKGTNKIKRFWSLSQQNKTIWRSHRNYNHWRQALKSGVSYKHMKALASIIQIKTGKSFRRARKASFSKCKSSATTSATIMVLGCRTDVRRFAGQDRKKDCCYSLLISTRHSCIVSDNTLGASRWSPENHAGVK